MKTKLMIDLYIILYIMLI